MPRRAAILLLAAYVLLVVAPIANAQSRGGPRAGHPLQWSRDPAARSAPAPVLRGLVTTVEGGTIVTSVSPADLSTHDVGDGDRISVEVGGKVLSARIASRSTYLGIIGDPAAAEGLDVDILGVVDDRDPGAARLVILGLGGGIAEWLRATPGMAVTLRVPR